MIKSSSALVPADNHSSLPQAPYHAEDAALKTAGLYFANELLPYFEIEGEVDHIGPTEIVHLDLRTLHQDLNLIMKDNSWAHFEFQSTNKGITDLKRFRTYEALTSEQYDVDVRTYVLYSGNIKNPVTEFTSGFNTYRVHPIIMKGRRAEEVFENITQKLENSIPLTKEDLVPLALCPLMGGDIPQKERISKALQLVRNSEDTFSDAGKLEAVIYTMASKFLDEKELNQIKEEIKMTALGTLIYNDGKAEGISQGIKQASSENARNFFLNGVSFDTVCNSIKDLSRETLQKIYDEVMSEQN